MGTILDASLVEVGKRLYVILGGGKFECVLVLRAIVTSAMVGSRLELKADNRPCCT